jgi:hypothetical protein
LSFSTPIRGIALQPIGNLIAEWDQVQIQQEQLCVRLGLEFVKVDPWQVIGLARNVASNLKPINGLRNLPTQKSRGWFIWAGQELSSDSDFFQPVHAVHLISTRPSILKYLGLPPGLRFLVVPDEKYEDVCATIRF